MNLWFFPSKLTSDRWQSFYQTKYEYHQKAYRWIVMLICLAEVSYFISDCQTFGYIEWKMLLPRMAILPPLIAFLIYNRNHNNYFWNIIFGYMLMHACMWCTVWAIYYLPDRNFAREGFIVMHFGFLALGLAAPYYMSTMLHAFIFFDIILSNQFNHYEYYYMMVSLAIPIYLGVVLLQKILENNYIDHYIDHCKLEELSTHDQLTGAYNRNILGTIRKFDTAQLTFASPANTWFLLMDVDYFKRVNDTYGHESGDRVLTMISDQIQQNIRAEDYNLRWGGEEFVIILQSVNKESAIATAERIRRAIESNTSVHPSVTVSIGVSHYNGQDYHTAINDADKAMYHAKHNGRNQVVCFEDLDA